MSKYFSIIDIIFMYIKNIYITNIIQKKNNRKSTLENKTATTEKKNVFFLCIIWTKIHSRTNKLRANSKSSCTLTKPETRNTLNTLSSHTSSRRGLCSVSMFHCCAMAILQSNDTVVVVVVVIHVLGMHTTCVVYAWMYGFTCVRTYVWARTSVCNCMSVRVCFDVIANVFIYTVWRTLLLLWKTFTSDHELSAAQHSTALFKSLSLSLSTSLSLTFARFVNFFGLLVVMLLLLFLSWSTSLSFFISFLSIFACSINAFFQEATTMTSRCRSLI